jgi:hypothetical protein
MRAHELRKAAKSAPTSARASQVQSLRMVLMLIASIAIGILAAGGHR